MKMMLQELRIDNYIERIQRSKDYFVGVVLQHSNEWLNDYRETSSFFDKNFEQNPDEADYYAETYQEEVFDYELIDYNIVGSTIVSIMSIWEQQLFDFIRGTSVKNTFDDIAQYYSSKYGFDIKHDPKVIEFKNVANIIKHGEGRSLNALVAQNSRFVKMDGDSLYQ